MLNSHITHGTSDTSRSARRSITPRARRAMQRAARPFTPLFALATAAMLIALVTRVAVVIVHGGWPLRSWAVVLRAFAVGTALDAVVTLWLLLPLGAYLAMVPPRWLGQRRHARIVSSGALLALTGMLFVAASEMLFFAEFDGRFNFVAVDYLIYPTEVVLNIWQTYHAGWMLTAIVLLAAGTVYTMRAPFRAESRAAARRERLPVAIAYALVLAVLSAAISPELAHVADDRALNEVATNGYYAFWEALRGRGTSYGALYATRRSELLLPRLHTLLADRSAPVSVFASQSTTRRVSTSRPARRLNVVVILEESLGSQFIGALHPGTPSLTPEIDALAARGTLLTNAYSTGNRTIRALEATTSSLPPLPGISVVRRPESVNLFTLPAVLRERGYATEFVYGGRAMFDGMGAYLRNNGVDHVIEQRDYPRAEFTTAWGVSDEAIFTKALASMDSLHGAGRPFYSLILTVSNHRPYTYPAGRVAADPNERKRVNVVRYADWALGRFMKEAARRPFFDRTVFVIMGDHGPRVYGAAEIPLASYAVPVLFYAPGIVPAARVGTLASSMDIPPTVLGLLGGRYESKFFGRDVLGGARGSTRGLAVMTHNNEVALMRDGRLAVLGLRGATALYAVDPSSGALQRVGSPDSSGRAMIEDAIAYFETADELYRRGDYRFERPADVVALAHGSSGTATPPRRDGPTTAVGATH